jgi:N-formylglutamate amidohydrolase
MTDSLAQPPFFRIGPDRPASPVVLSVPHAGRAYSADLMRAARVPTHVLEALEDRLVDRLVWRAVAAGAIAIVASVPRAEIDLNRDEREIDPAMVAPPPVGDALMSTVRMRGGLGLIPSRIAGTGALWRGRMSRDELNRRVERVHRPYHAALAQALARARELHGAAVLIDCHSMPPRLPANPGTTIVFGDRYGTTMAPQLLEVAIAAAQDLGFEAACNDPYAGGHIIERHGRLAEGIHALQIEIDRSAYLDTLLRSPGPGFDRAARLIAGVSEALAAAARGDTLPIAAE